MSWFQNLDQIAAADPALVGYNAYYLGQLKQKGLPVTDGWVLTTEAWRQVLSQMVWPEPEWADSLLAIDLDAVEHLQQTSRAWQQALNTANVSTPFTAEVLALPLSRWMVRASLWLETLDTTGGPWFSSLNGLLPEMIGGGSGSQLLQALSSFWGQALRARSLVVWQQYCQSLKQLGLGTLVMPLYPAQVTGRLTLTSGIAQIEAVVGLGLPLNRGEAIPARCQIDLNQPGRVTWQAGYQEQVYRLVEASASHVSASQASDYPAAAHGAVKSVLQAIERPQPELTAPLDAAQLTTLLQLAEQVQAALPGDRVQVEWLLCPLLESNPLQLVITQAMPWLRRNQTAPESRQPGSARQVSPLKPPLLPQISAVVKGIGASSGRIRGRAIVAQHPQDLPTPLPSGCIVVLPDLQPDRFLQLEAVAGIVIEQGGATCHAAILAREMGVPAVVGAPQATQLLDPDLVLWLDGEQGLVYGLTEEASVKLKGSGLSPVRLPDPGTTPDRREPWFSETNRFRSLQTKVMVNLSQSSRVKHLPIDHIDGIGLLRSEWLMLEILEQRHPWHWVEQGQEAELQARLAQILAPIVQAMGDKPVRYRSLDLRSHEWQALEGSPPPDANPMLGLRGTLSYGIDSRLFEVELGALATLQRSGHHNLQLILPFVRSVEEVITCRQYITRAGLNQNEGFALWIMAEVPSVLFLLPAYARSGVQGIAIGSNDLTQLLLAIDRDQHTLASAYDERHPVVRMALAYLIQEARRSNMACSICGQAPVRHPELIAELVAWGIHSISVETGALPFTLEAIWQAEQGRT